MPRVEQENGHLKLLTSWPVADNWHLGRSRLEATGNFSHESAGTHLSWTGTISQEDDMVSRTGTVQAETVVDDRNDRTLSSRWVVERDVRPHWREGLTQHQHLELQLSYQGPAAPLPISPPPAEDSRYADLLPLVLSNGEALQHPEIHAETALPFLVLPDTWTAADIAAALGG